MNNPRKIPLEDAFDSHVDMMMMMVAAIRKIQDLGYTYDRGSEEWNPPLGEKPDFERDKSVLESARNLVWELDGRGVRQQPIKKGIPE